VQPQATRIVAGEEIRMIFQNITCVRTQDQFGQKDMESSRRYLLQAEIEYWHEMLQLNQSRIPKSREEEMRVCLKKALRAFNSNPVGEFRAAA
jgi:hypothetical protein